MNMRPNYQLFFDNSKNELLRISKSKKTNQSCRDLLVYLEEQKNKINDWLRQNNFESEQEEINFFKVLKPELVSSIIFYKKVLGIQLNLPAAKTAIPNYYEKLIEKNSQKPNSLKSFYLYVKNESTYRDQEYFLRTNNQIDFNDQYQTLFYDERTTTKMECVLAEMLAKEKIIVYLENKLEELNNSNSKNKEVNSNLNWTASKVDLTELIYALHLQKAINNGEVELKEVAMQLCKTFNIKYDDSIYRHYTDIKRRKSDTKAKFIQSLSNSLNNKILQEEY